MLQAGGQPDLAEKPLGPERRGQFGAKHLECDQAAVLAVPGQVDRRHSAPAELIVDAVPIGQVSREAGEDHSPLRVEE